MKADNIRFSDFEQIRSNFWQLNGKSYRLFGKDTTPNGCWRIAPKFVEIEDIDISTGETVWGEEIQLEYSTVPAVYQVIRY